MTALNLTGYKLTFDDEFNTLSAGKPNTQGIVWETSPFYGDLSNGGQGTINTASLGQPGSPYSISNGVLTMTVSLGSAPYLDTNPGGVTGGFSQKYGYFEMNAKLTGVSGFSDAFWLLPNSGPWPPEIDIEEHAGAFSQERAYTNHGGDINTPAQSLDLFSGPDVTTAFHTYGLMWTPQTITWYFDGSAVFSAPTASNEQQAMSVILSAYANNGLGYVPDAQPGTSATMQVNYVHVYSNDGSNAEIAGQAGYQNEAGSVSLGGSTPPPVVPPPVVPPPVSGVVAPGGGNVIDGSGNTWNITAAGNIDENGVAIDGGGGTSGLFWNTSTKLIEGQDGASGSWYSWNGTTWVAGGAAPTSSNSGGVTPPPVTPPLPMPPPVTVMTVTDDIGTKASVAIATTGTSTFKGALDSTITQSVANGLTTISFDTHVRSETITLGLGNYNLKFVSPKALQLTGGSGNDTVKANSGPLRNLFTAGTGTLDVTGGSDGSTYTFHANSGKMIIEDFNTLAGDSLSVDKGLKAGFHTASDGRGGSMLSFGTAGSIDLVSHAAVTSASVHWI